MNPLDFSGPGFLAFFMGFGLFVLGVMIFWIRDAELAYPVPGFNPPDPYEIAYLRGGRAEMLRVVVFSLIDRGLLVLTESDKLKTVSQDAVSIPKRDIERSVLKAFITEELPETVFKNDRVDVPATFYRNRLERWKVLPDIDTFKFRMRAIAVAVAIVCALSIAKIVIAAQRHRPFFFLLLLSGLIVWLLVSQYRRKRTFLGDRVVRDLQKLFVGLMARAPHLKAGGATNEAALAAAIFGLSALPYSRFPYVEKIFKKKVSSTGTNSYDCGTGLDDCGSSFGSSNASGCGSSCGSSCGGGGCGGGCGGCGS